jgi:hypothetical protein
MFVETADSNAGLLHDIGNADAFQTEFAKPLGSNAHDPSVRLRLVTLRITHLPSPSLPESIHGSPGRATRVSASSSAIGCELSRPWCKKLIASIVTMNRFHNEAGTEMSRKDFIKYFATSGLRSYSSVEKARINLFPSTGEAI